MSLARIDTDLAIGGKALVTQSDDPEIAQMQPLLNTF